MALFAQSIASHAQLALIGMEPIALLLPHVRSVPI